MVYSRRRSYGYRPRRFKQRKTNWVRMAKQGFWMAKKAIGFLNAESKYFDVYYANGNAINTTAPIALTGNIARGTAVNQRVAASILPSGMACRLQWNIGASSPANCRAMIIRDNNDADNTTPTLAQVLNTSNGDPCLALMNKDNSERFRIIRDWKFSLDTSNATHMIDEFITFPKHKDKHGVNTIGDHCTWDSSDNIEKGHLYLIVISNKASSNPTVNYTIRTNFYDN